MHLFGSFVAFRCFQWEGGIRSLPASSRQPTPEFAFAFKDFEVPPDQLLGVVRAGYIHSLFRGLRLAGSVRPSPARKTISSAGPWSGL
jgi:hypothetical protein